MSYRISFLGSIRFEFIYAAILTVIILFTSGFSNVKSPLLKYVILLFLCILIQIPFSYDLNISWNIFIDRVLKFIFMAVFIATFVKSPKHLVYFLSAFLLACLKLGQEGFIGQITGSMVWENQGLMRLHGSTPMYAHPNSFSGMALGTVPFIYYLFPIAPLWVKAILIIMLVFAINIIIFTGSRTGYVAFFIFIIFAFLQSKKKKKYAVYALIIGAISISMIPKNYIERFDSIFTGKEREGGSYEARKEILNDAWQIFLDHPLGVGVAAFPAVRKATFGRKQDTHNLYFEIATNLGIQGFIVFMLFINNMMKMLYGITRGAYKQIQGIEVIIRGADSSRYTSEEITRHLFDLKLIYATGSAVFMFLVIRLALGFFGMDLYEIYWWFALGLAISLYNIHKCAQAKTEAFLEKFARMN